MSLEINSQYDFFKNVKLDEDGNLLVAMTSGVSGSGDVIFVDAFANFPNTGSADALYIDETANVIYRFDEILNSYQVLNDPEVVNPDADEVGTLFYVTLTSTSALSAATYDNGTAGVGATLTGNANGILSEVSFNGQIDGTTPTNNMEILVQGQANQRHNGIYTVTQVGNAGAPFILTRTTGYDEPSEIFPSTVTIGAGLQNRGRYFTQKNNVTSIGVQNILYQTAPAPANSEISSYVDTIASSALPACTYANGTIYPTVPGFEATLTANDNGALGTINGVALTTGRRVLVIGQANQAHNGIYSVQNGGTAGTPWVLRRTIGDSSMFYNRREFVVSNVSSTRFGTRWSVSSPLSMSNASWGITNIVFRQQNLLGLKTSNDRIQLDETDGVSDISLNTNNTVGFGVYDGSDESTFQLSIGAIQGSVTNGTAASSLSITPNEVNIVSEDNISITSNNSSFSVYAESGEFNIYGAPVGDWYIGDTDGNKGFIKRIGGVGILNEVQVGAGAGTLHLSSAYLKASPLPNYANDAAADADTDLPSGAFYTLGAGRATYQKP